MRKPDEIIDRVVVPFPKTPKKGADQNRRKHAGNLIVLPLSIPFALTGAFFFYMGLGMLHVVHGLWYGDG